MKRARILLADDHQLTLAGIHRLLETSYDVVAEVNDGAALVKAAAVLQPDLIVLDISMPQMNGLDAAAQIRKSMPEAKLLFLTMHANAKFLAAALSAGATGYVLKTAAAEELLKAVGSVLKGGVYVSPGISGEHLERFGDPARAAASIRLSPREQDVLRLISEGHASKEIGFLLAISPRTVEFHRENIKRKLGLRSTAELTRHAMTEDQI